MLPNFKKVERFFQILSIITILSSSLILFVNSVKLTMVILILSMINIIGLTIIEKIKPIREEDDEEWRK